jgi:hypothetical protein
VFHNVGNRVEGIYLHLDEGILYWVIGLAYLEDRECYAGGSIATGRVSLAGQYEGERSDDKRYPGPPGWGWRRWTSTPILTKKCSLAKNHRRQWNMEGRRRCQTF